MRSSCAFEWQSPPRHTALQDGQLHIWRVELPAQLSPDESAGILSADEQQRALRLRSPLIRASFQAARAALRSILSIYLQQPPQSIRFSYGPKGKPALHLSCGAGSLEFNLAHSEDLMLAAFTTCGPVGIDLEINQPISAKEHILGQFFSSQDQAAFRNTPEQDQPGAFLSAWVRKEAYGKALGTGLAAPHEINHFAASAKDLPANHYELLTEDNFWFMHFTPQAGFTAAAVLMSGEKPQISFWDYPKLVKNNQLDSFFKD